MAANTSRAHLFHQLSRRAPATSSPRDEEYATATASSFDAARDAIHSTAQLPDYTTQQQLPQQTQPNYDQFPDSVSEGGSEGSAELSIELGRGVKRHTRARNEDVSSNLMLNMGNDSLYEVTGTPPMRSHSGPKNANDGLRRQASLRRATETAKTNDAAKRTSGMKARALSEALHQINTEDEASFMAEEQTATFHHRNTRFTRSRQASANIPKQQTPHRGVNNNGTVQSNSFMLPDLPNITELVSGVRKDGTPLFNRAAKSRSRFTSGSYRPSAPAQHHPIESVPIPEEEKVIYASLQVLKERVDQLELEKSKSAKRAEEYESEIIDLRSQLAVAQRRPDSGLGSSASDDDVQGYQAGKADNTRLQASVKALQDRFDRSERKVSIAEIAVKRVTKERNDLITQIGVAYYNNEELKAENEILQAQHEKLVQANEELKGEADALRSENQDLRVLMSQIEKSYEDESRRYKKSQAARQPVQDKPRHGTTNPQHARNKEPQTNVESRKAGVFHEITSDDLAVRIAQEVRKNREEASAAAKAHILTNTDRMNRPRQTRNRSRSKSPSREQTNVGAEPSVAASKREASRVPVDAAGSDIESASKPDITQRSRKDATKRASLPTPAKAGVQTRSEDTRDLTLLSWQDPIELNKLRKKLEEDRRAGRLQASRAVSAPDATQQSQGLLGRKSSLKDVTAASENGTGRFDPDDFARIAKSVRVQSPHVSDESINPGQQTETGDMSILSNTSRRRRRAASAENMTSAFILPDITLHNAQSLKSAGIQHDEKSCTACPMSKDMTIPTPVPVTDRPEDVADVTNATIRPSQAPPLALATVIKQLQDEIAHLKSQLTAQQRLYNQHDPALSKRRRQDVRVTMDKLTSEIEKRSDQVYSLFDVLEGQKEAGNEAKALDEDEVEQTLESLGIDPVELSGRIGRKALFGLDGAGDVSGEESEELPWEGLSEVESEEEVFRPKRRRSGLF